MGSTGQRAEEGVDGEEKEPGGMEGMKEARGEEEGVCHEGISDSCAAAEEGFDEVEKRCWKALR